MIVGGSILLSFMQVCAESPREITHQMHPHHPLLLLQKRVENIICNGCRESSNGYTYSCAPCDFDLHIVCATPQETRNYAHIHHHSLAFQRRTATFVCDFCAVKDEYQSYKCYTCDFWVHKKCASMPLTSQLNFHPHPFSLVQGMPEDLQVYKLRCEVCHTRPLSSHWMYYCGPCRYFIHIKCMKSLTKRLAAYYSHRDAVDYIDDSFFKYLLNDDLLHLPVDNFVDLIRRFLVDKNSLIDIQHGIQDFSHVHPLILITGQLVNNDEYFEEEDEEILCDGCIEPITAPYYRCMECNYYLHVPCAHLPAKLQHPAHSHHELTLYHPLKFYKAFTCNHCYKQTNGFIYSCDDCDFSLDLKCATLPNVIKHETHDHPLIQDKASRGEMCYACHSGKEGDLIFKCKRCNISLHNSCAMLPKRFRHRWDRNHPIILRFPAHHEHPDHIMCDMCEEIILPRRWLYSCFKCKMSFHLYCPPKLHRYPNIMFGGEVQISSHSHPLKYFRQSTLKTLCDNACGGGIKKTNVVFECETCYTCMCYKCVIKQLP